MSIRAFRGRTRAHACAALVVAFAATLFAARTQAALPDGRAYELVSPAEKLGAVPHFPAGGTGTGFANFGAVTAASSDGEQVMWFSLWAFGNAESALPMNYESRRTADGWTTIQASPDPTDEEPHVLLSPSVIQDVTDDFGGRIIPSTQNYDPLIQDFFGRRDLFLQDAQHNLTWLTRPNSGPATTPVLPSYMGRDETARHVLFATPEILVPEASSTLAGRVLYDHTGGQTVLVSQTTGGAIVSACGAVLGWGVDAHGDRMVRRAITPDASHVYFTAPDPNGSGDVSCDDPEQLYLREGGTTTQVSTSQRVAADPLGRQPAMFEGASADGERVFFLSAEALTEDAADGTDPANWMLYEYDVASRVLSLLTPNRTSTPFAQGIADMADDGSILYVASSGELIPGRGTPGERNLYAYARREFTFIGTVGNGVDILAAENNRPAIASPDGTRFAFASSADIRGFSAGGRAQVYVYDQPSDTLYCASCPTNGAPIIGDAALQRDQRFDTRRSFPRNITDDGERVFFDTPVGLVSEDDNEAIDVYEWKDGEVRLLSGGHGSGASFFADASSDGSDVFFVTTDRLVPQDTNVDPDFYDARIGGGFEAPGVGEGPCVDDACQGTPTPPPVLPGAVSETEFGDGNVVQKPGSDRFSVGAISARSRRAFARTGRLTLVVRVGDAGTARAVASARLRGRSKTVARAAGGAPEAGRVRLQLALSRAARRRLARRGRLGVTIVVTFSGAERSKRATLVLTKPNGSGR